MRTRCNAGPLEAVLDRRAGVRRSNKHDLGNSNLLFAIPKIDPADVAIEIDDDGFDNNGVAGIENGSILRSGDRQARLGNAVVANEYFRTLVGRIDVEPRSEEHTSELQSHGLISYAVFCLK